jgi:hypothetical protein
MIPMPHIKEPYGIDFLVENNPVTEEDKKLISEVIAHYKATGRKKYFKEKLNNSPKKVAKKKAASGKAKIS